MRYPGFKSSVGKAHIDNGNNSLLPPSKSDRSYAQIIFWPYLEDVDEDQSPTWFIRSADGEDVTRTVDLVGPAGTLAIFHNYTWHGARDYERTDRQKYIWKFAYGHADYDWEGVAHYTHVGADPHFREFIFRSVQWIWSGASRLDPLAVDARLDQRFLCRLDDLGGTLDREKGPLRCLDCRPPPRGCC